MAQLRAAAGHVDLRPPPHQLLAGFGARLHRAVGCHDPLNARMLILDGGARLAWLACALLRLSAPTDATRAGPADYARLTTAAVDLIRRTLQPREM